MNQAQVAGQNAMDALQALQEAGDQATAVVTSVAGDLNDLFGKQGPVQGWINTQPELGEELLGNPGDPIPPDLGTPEGDPIEPDLGLIEGDPIPPDLGLIEGDPIPPDLGLTEGDPIPPGLLGSLINYDSPAKAEGEPEGEFEEEAQGTSASPLTPFEEWAQNNEWDYSYVDDDGYQTPRSNQAQNEAFDSGVREAESQLGRQLGKDEIQRLHMEISGQGLSRQGIIERAITMFGS